MRSFLVLMMAVAACGDDGNHTQLPDAPIIDGAPDAAPMPVTLTVTKGTAPVSGVKVYFQNADSSVVLATNTDVNGVASAVMVAGGYVTAIDAVTEEQLGVAPGLPSPPTFIQTFAKVKPGDQLVLHQDQSTGTGVPITMTFQMADEPSDSAIRYEAWSSCFRAADVSGPGSGAPPGGSADFDGCPTTTDVTAIAFNAANEPFASILKTGVAVADATTIDLSNLTNTPYVNSELVSYTYQNVPGSIASFLTQSFQVTPRGIMYETDVNNTVNSGNGGVSDVVRPKLAGTTQVDYSQFSGPVNASYQILEWGTPKTDYLVADTGAILPHEYNAQPAFDVATNSLTWTVDAAGVAPTFVRGFFRASRGKGTTRWDWDIVDSGAATSIKLPTLPAPDDIFNATAGDDFHSIDGLTTGSNLGGYDAIRANLLSVSRFGTPLGLVVGANGQVTFEQLSFGSPAKRHQPRNPFVLRARR